MNTIVNHIKNLLKVVLRTFFIVTKDNVDQREFISVGSHKHLARYKYLYLGKDAKVSHQFSFSFAIQRVVKKLFLNTGLIIIKDKKLAAKFREEVVMQPNFIELEIPLPNTLDEYYKLITGDARNNLKKAKKVGFSFTISHDRKWVDVFFTHFYSPSMLNRHDDDAYLMSKDEMISLINQPGAEFLQVNLDNQCVASAIAVHEGEKYSYAKVGWLKGDNTLLEQGVTTAIYQHLIERAFELGCKKINLGGTPPFLESGVLKYKAKWQPRFCPDIYYAENYLLLNPSINAGYDFLKNNSLVAFGLTNELIVLSAKLPEETHIPGHLLSDIQGWFLLRQERVDNYTEGMDELPEHLRYWYQKIS